MGRTPCCEKKGLKRGPWTHEEDHILISYIQQNGHDNWRALPKQAGLLRCGKSCRLRWTNYLRPGIKRGNFSAEEEDTIMKLHEMIGNRWSAIAARLPGRTDNEIKNYWRTHLMKRLSTNAVINNTKHVAELETSAVTEMGKNAAVLEDGIDGKHEEMSNNSPNFELLNEDLWADVLSENEFQLQCNATTCGRSWWLEDDDKLDYSWGS